MRVVIEHLKARYLSLRLCLSAKWFHLRHDVVHRLSQAAERFWYQRISFVTRTDIVDICYSLIEYTGDVTNQFCVCTRRQVTPQLGLLLRLLGSRSWCLCAI